MEIYDSIAHATRRLEQWFLSLFGHITPTKALVIAFASAAIVRLAASASSAGFLFYARYWLAWFFHQRADNRNRISFTCMAIIGDELHLVAPEKDYSLFEVFDDTFLAHQVRRSANTVTDENPLPSFRGDPAAKLEEKLSWLAESWPGHQARRIGRLCQPLLQRGRALGGNRKEHVARAGPTVRDDVYIHLIKKMSALANGSFAFDVGRVPMDIFKYRIILTCDLIRGRTRHFRCLAIWEDTLNRMPTALRVPNPAMAHFANYFPTVRYIAEQHRLTPDRFKTFLIYRPKAAAAVSVGAAA
jgi:hypothetical protein